jgi:hypothetical protein
MSAVDRSLLASQIFSIQNSKSEFAYSSCSLDEGLTVVLSLFSMILDGEMLVWDPNLVKYMPFGNLKTFAIPTHKEMGPNDPRPCCKPLWFFHETLPTSL